jgi:small GTP-binding protein
MVNTVIGIIAHVDAGKTTLSEAMLYLGGAIRSPGRVDHQNAFLDTEDIEKARGITIFSKQAIFTLPQSLDEPNRQITLLDTPGHVDFGAEAERVLQVLDYAILVVSGADGIQGHTLTMWHLLEKYKIPTFLFVNKMDQPGTDRTILLQEIAQRLSSNTIAFDESRDSKFWENLVMCDEELMEAYLEGRVPKEEQITALIADRRIFPCYFGSALKMTGVSAFMEDLGRYAVPPCYPAAFGARVYKITRDKQGMRLTHMKITGGVLHTKDILGDPGEKINQIRVYSGEKYETPKEATAGTICAVVGSMHLEAGECLGIEKGKQTFLPILEPVLEYQLLLPSDWEPHQALGKLRMLEEEKPQLHIVWEETTGEIHVRLMGEVEREILKVLVKERFGAEVDFGPGRIIYKETIQSSAEGVGHYEPLRHYAEVHLLLSPGDAGSGLIWENHCPPDTLEDHYQKQILTELQTGRHIGVLTGSEITDMKITLLTGRAHLKHTQGGDFRQAAFRAMRQGLRKAKTVLLEPIYAFRLEIPAANLGRAISDLQKMESTAVHQGGDEETAVLTGRAPVWHMRNYSLEVAAYSRGFGKLTCSLAGYTPCGREQEVAEEIGYDPDQDIQHPSGSIFCSHGAGYWVPWDQVEQVMHLPAAWEGSTAPWEEIEPPTIQVPVPPSRSIYADEAELKAIFEKTYGPIRRDKNPPGRTAYFAQKQTNQSQSDIQSRRPKEQPKLEKYLLVDGYNVIFAWKDLSELAKINLEAARTRLMDILCNYQGFRQETVILVFDAYRVEGNPGSSQTYHNIYVIYTKEAETADQYVEKAVHQMGKKFDVTVATSDAAEQMIIWGDGARRLSAQGLLAEIKRTEEEIRELTPKTAPGQRHYPIQDALQKQRSTK